MSSTESALRSPELERERVPAIPGYAWVILSVVLLASVAASLNQFKAPPLIPVLIDAFRIDLGQAGLLMSVFALTGLILALPAGWIVQRLGAKTTGLLAMACLIVGASWGALAGGFGSLLGSRVIEGAGLGLIAVAGPAAVALWFPLERRGLPMGIWAIWVPLGSVLMFNLAPALEIASGWRAVWWAGAIVSLIALVLYALLMRPPLALSATFEQTASADSALSFGAALANRSIWLLGLEFACFNVVFLGFFTFFATFLVEERGYPLAQAAFIASLATLTGLVSAPLAGWLSDRSGSRRLFIAVPFLLIAALLIFPFHLTGWALYALVIVLGIVSGATPTATFAAVPEVMGDPRLAGIGMAVVALGMNLGVVLGPTLFGMLVQSLGWATAGYWLVPVSLLGFVAAWLVKVR